MTKSKHLIQRSLTPNESVSINPFPEKMYIILCAVRVFDSKIMWAGFNLQVPGLL